MMHILCLLLSSICLFWTCETTGSINTHSNNNCFNRTSDDKGVEIVTTICANATVSSRSYNWTDAENECQLNGGHLISITTDEKNNRISLLIEDSTNDCWIGLVAIAYPDRYWAWVDGTDSSYSHWNLGEPSNHNRDEYCTEMYGPQAKLNGTTLLSSWNDNSCNQTFDCFICGNVVSPNIITIRSTATPTSTVNNTTTATHINTAETSSNWTPSLLSTVMSSVDDKLLSTDGDIALIVLAAIFFLTTIGLVVFIFKLKYKESRPAETTGHHPTKAHGVNNDAYGLNEPEPNTPAMYYDTQNETVIPDGNNMDNMDSYGNQRDITDQLGVVENQFADNEVYG